VSVVVIVRTRLAERVFVNPAQVVCFADALEIHPAATASPIWRFPAEDVIGVYARAKVAGEAVDRVLQRWLERAREREKAEAEEEVAR